MKFTGGLPSFTINMERYKQRLAQALSEQLAFALFQWLDATVDQLPQWSGASAATFLHLAREIGYSLTITVSGTAPNRIQLGLNNGEGEFHIDRDRGVAKFRYRSTLRYLAYNEYHNANLVPDPGLKWGLLNPGPYHFQRKGRAAFESAVDDGWLPDPFVGLKRKNIKV